MTIEDKPLPPPVPHAPEAEIAILGAMLMEPACIPRVTAIIDATVFHAPRNRILYDTILRIAGRSDPVTTITLVEELRATKQLTAAGGVVFVSDITDAFTSAANVEFYARVVADKAALRKLAALGESISARTSDAGADTILLLSEVEKSIAAIGQERRAGSEDALIVKSWNALDLIHAKLKPPPCLLGAGVLYRNSLSILFGREGMGKSWLSIQLALAVANHEPFFGIKTTKVSTGTAIFSLEMPDWQISKRITRLTEETQHRGAECITIVCREGLRTAMDLRSAAHVDAVIAHCIRNNVQLLVLDAMSRIHWSDENDAREMAIIIAAADRIRIEANVCVLILHHERKPQNGAKSEGVHSDHMAALRGSTVIPAGVHSGMRILPVQGHPVLVCAKANWGRKFDPVWLRQITLPPTINEDGDEEENGGWFALGKQPTDSQDHAERNREAVLNFVAAAEFPVTADEALFQLALKTPEGKPLRVETVRKYLRSLEEAKILASEGKTRARRWFLISPGEASSATL